MDTDKKPLLGEHANLAGLIGYQTGSVVSRTLINTQAGTITLFAFDRGQGLSEHTAPFDAFVYILEGSVDITIAGSKQRLVQADAIIMPAGKPHALAAPEPFKMALIMIRSA